MSNLQHVHEHDGMAWALQAGTYRLAAAIAARAGDFALAGENYGLAHKAHERASRALRLARLDREVDDLRALAEASYHEVYTQLRGKHEAEGYPSRVWRLPILTAISVAHKRSVPFMVAMCAVWGAFLEDNRGGRDLPRFWGVAACVERRAIAALRRPLECDETARRFHALAATLEVAR